MGRLFQSHEFPAIDLELAAVTLRVSNLIHPSSPKIYHYKHIMWKQLEPTGAHLTYILLPFFLLMYALFSYFIRNRLHLSEPPLATLFGIIIGPEGLGIVQPREWGLGDNNMIEITRIVASIQCFVVGIELPRGYMRQHWSSLALLLGPVMAFGWLVCGGFIAWLFDVNYPTALVISACLTPTDPVLAASVLSGSKFSDRIPLRIRHLLGAESGCNDGVSFPFLYVGISILTRATIGGTLKKWILITLLYQCVVGIVAGLIIGFIANHLLHFSEQRKFIGHSSYIVFYLWLSLFCIGVASTLGLDDFLVTFSAGVAFSQHGWFWSAVAESKLPHIIDLNLNSAMFIYFGTDIPWRLFYREDFPYFGPGRLIGLLALILAFRRLPIVLALKPLIKDAYTWYEAVFIGHFGPMGVGALFLALEARAQLETDTSTPLPHVPDASEGLDPRRQRALEIIWPIICFVVLGSILVHGLSTLAISLFDHFSRDKEERHPLIAGETERLYGMIDDRRDDIEGDQEDEADHAG